MADITDFQLTDTIFSDPSLRAMLTQDEIDLINSSPLLKSLLHAYESLDIKITHDSSKDYSGYDPKFKTINITQTGSDFVRVLGHELTHYYDQIKRKELTLTRNNFDDIINREMDESEATAASFIIRRQIMANHDEHPDIGISNRINVFDPDPGRDIIADLDSAYASQVSSSMTIDDFWALTNQIATEKIWGMNFHTRPHKTTNRWEDALNDVYILRDAWGDIISDDTPDFLKDDTRIFQSAELLEDGTHKFTFQDQDANHTERTWIYESRNGDDGDNLVTGTESVTDDHLTGGAGNDIIYGDWQETDAGNDTLDGGLGDDHLYDSSPKAFSPHRAVFLLAA